MISGLESKPTNAITVLKHEHSIAVKTSNDWSSGSRAEASLRHAEFSVKRFAE
jgi:hypothetical protein